MWFDSGHVSPLWGFDHSVLAGVRGLTAPATILGPFGAAFVPRSLIFVATHVKNARLKLQSFQLKGH
jgi:hypothetical protein